MQSRRLLTTAAVAAVAAGLSAAAHAPAADAPAADAPAADAPAADAPAAHAPVAIQTPGAAAARPPRAAASARPKRSTAVGVAAREFRLSVYRPRVRAGEVRLNLANYGEDAHDLVVRDRSGRVRGRSEEVRPGGRTTLALRLGRGGYRLSCDVADHARRGMRATLKVVR